MSDPEITAAEDRAVLELTRRLRPWAAAMQDPEGFARSFVLDFLRVAEDWRPGLPAKSWQASVSGAPAVPNEEWRKARAALEAHAGENS